MHVILYSSGKYLLKLIHFTWMYFSSPTNFSMKHLAITNKQSTSYHFSSKIKGICKFKTKFGKHIFCSVILHIENYLNTNNDQSKKKDVKNLVI